MITATFYLKASTNLKVDKQAMERVANPKRYCQKTKLFFREFKRRLNAASNDVCGEKEKEEIERLQWSHRFVFFLVLLGNSFNFGQIWRMPQIAFKNGRGVFLICYGTCLLTFGYSAHLLEILLGQYTSRSAASVFGLVPAGIGIGLASIIHGFIFIVHSNQIVAYSIYYLFHAFSNPLPWSICHNATHSDLIRCSSDCNSTSFCSSPSRYYWEHMINQEYRRGDPNFGVIGGPIPGLVFSSVVAWSISAVSGSSGLKSVERLMYITVPLPYLFLLILLAVSTTAERAWDGLAEYFDPDLSKFSDPKVWLLALEHAFYSLGVGKASNLIASSHAKFTSASHVDSFAVSLGTFYISISCGTFVFSMLGLLKETQNSFNDIAASGPGLIFIVYTEALSLMPAPMFCSVVFFLMLICIGTSTVATAIACFSTCILDVFPRFRRHRSTLTFLLSCLAFLLGLPVMCRGGLTYFDVLEKFAGGYPLLPICALELLLVSYCYGLGRFCEDVAFMLGWYPNRFIRYTWGLGGFLHIAASGFSFYLDDEPSFGVWWNFLGVAIILIILIPIPVAFVVQIVRYKKEKRLKNCFRPNPDHGPADLRLKVARKELKIKRRIL